MTSAGASIQLAPARRRSPRRSRQWRTPSSSGRSRRRPSPIDPAASDVTVLNGSGRRSRPRTSPRRSPEAVPARSSAGNADHFDYASSAVYYAPAFREPARKIAALLGPRRERRGARRGAKAHGNEVVVIAGADFTGTLATAAEGHGAARPTRRTRPSLVAPPCARASKAGRLPRDGAAEGRPGSRVRIVRAANRITRRTGDQQPAG